MANAWAGCDTEKANQAAARKRRGVLRILGPREQVICRAEGDEALGVRRRLEDPVCVTEPDELLRFHSGPPANVGGP